MISLSRKAVVPLRILVPSELATLPVSATCQSTKRFRKSHKGQKFNLKKCWKQENYFRDLQVKCEVLRLPQVVTNYVCHLCKLFSLLRLKGAEKISLCDESFKRLKG